MRFYKALWTAVTAISIFALTSCGQSLNAAETFLCEAVSISWDEPTYSEIEDYEFLLETYGRGRLGDNSETTKTLKMNSEMADVLAVKVDGDDSSDKELVSLADDFKWQTKWAYDKGKMFEIILMINGKPIKPHIQAMYDEAIKNQQDADETRLLLIDRCKNLGYSEG